MKAADEYQTVAPGLYCWQAYEPSVKADLTSIALVAEGKLIFIDPIPLARDSLQELAQEGEPALIVLTNGNHTRAAEWYRQRFGLPVAAMAAEIAIDRELRDGEALAPGVTVQAVPGAGPGEIALLAGEALLFGDAVINLPPYGFSLLPEKYCADAREMKASLQKLLRHPFRILTFAHGLPLVTDAHERLARLLS